MTNFSERCIAPAAGLSGGATVSGGSYVNDVRTASTDSTFTRVGEPIEFLIQLVCNQTDEEKYTANRQYEQKQRFEKREKLLAQRKQHEKVIDSLKAEQERELSKIAKLDEELQQYHDLGSYIKEDYLVSFK